MRWYSFGVFAIIVVVIYLLVSASPSEAQHQMSGKTWIWRNYLSTWSNKEVQWQTCGTSDYEYGLAGLAFNNWRSRFGRGIYHTYVGINCVEQNDNALRVYATTQTTLSGYCPGSTRGCFKPRSCIDSLGRWNSTCDYGLQKVLQAYIVYNRFWLLNDPEVAWNTLAQVHFFGHEFGHGMGLEDHTVCSDPFVMTGAGCTTLVNAGVYPNDVCVPDRLLGYTPLRC